MKQTTVVLDPWRNFKGSKWKKSIDVRDFILNNVTVYYGDESFLEGPTEATKKRGVQPSFFRCFPPFCSVCANRFWTRGD